MYIYIYTYIFIVGNRIYEIPKKSNIHCRRWTTKEELSKAGGGGLRET
jgi:hypothetical protein